MNRLRDTLHVLGIIGASVILIVALAWGISALPEPYKTIEPVEVYSSKAQKIGGLPRFLGVYEFRHEGRVYLVFRLSSGTAVIEHHAIEESE